MDIYGEREEEKEDGRGHKTIVGDKKGEGGI